MRQSRGRLEEEGLLCLIQHPMKLKMLEARATQTQQTKKNLMREQRDRTRPSHPGRVRRRHEKSFFEKKVMQMRVVVTAKIPDRAGAISAKKGRKI